MEGTLGKTLSRTGCSHKVGVVVNVKRLKSDIYLSLSVWHSTSRTNFSSRELIEWSFLLNDIKFKLFNFSWIIYSIFIFYFEFWCGRNLRVHLSIGCPRYHGTIPGKYLQYWIISLSSPESLPTAQITYRSPACFRLQTSRIHVTYSKLPIQASKLLFMCFIIVLIYLSSFTGKLATNILYKEKRERKA